MKILNSKVQTKMTKLEATKSQIQIRTIVTEVVFIRLVSLEIPSKTPSWFGLIGVAQRTLSLAIIGRVVRAKQRWRGAMI